MDLLDWARAMFALIATLALIGGAAYAARRLGMLQPNAQGARRMRVTESLMLDPRRRLVLVRLDGREHLILCGPSGDVVIANTEAQPERPAAEPQA